MKYLIPIVLTLVGCEQIIFSSEYRDGHPGAIYELTAVTVTIRGIYDAFDGKTAEPNATMRAQAEAVCPNAEFLSATPYPYDNWTFLYLFRCP